MFNVAQYNPSSPLLEELRDQFKRDHYAVFPDFIDQKTLEGLRGQVHSLIDKSLRRDFLMECMDNSPRKMNVVSGPMIEDSGSTIPHLYNDQRLMNFVSAVIEEEVLALEDDVDRYVVNHLGRKGDTFGAHYDDYPLSFVVIINSPDRDGGGFAEMVPRANSLADLEESPIQLPLKPGDAYVLKTDTTAHRVAPLSRDVDRTAINLAYTTPGFVPLGTDSAALLYGD